MIALYALDAEGLTASPAAYTDRLPEGSLERLSRLTPEDQLLGLGAELLFQQAVQRHCPHLPLPAKRERGENGKPYLPDAPDFHFNLSHSGRWAVCAVSDKPIGVDLQQRRPVKRTLARTFTASEQRELEGLSPDEWEERFFRLWVKKEAYVKCTGEGLLRTFRSFESDAPAPGYVTISVPFPETGYELAVCTAGDAPEGVSVTMIAIE